MTKITRRPLSVLRRIDDAMFGSLRTEFVRLLGAELTDPTATILDVGCGARSPLGGVEKRWLTSVGVDVHLPSLRSSARSQLHEAHVAADIRQLEDVFKPKSFDILIALDVIEHLPKDDGLRLLRAMDALARRKVIVFTPSGFLAQAPYDDNPFQEHVSGWSAAEMREHGFTVVGVNGWKPLRTERAAYAYRPYTLAARLSWLSQPLVRTRPHRAFQLLCVKKLP